MALSQGIILTQEGLLGEWAGTLIWGCLFQNAQTMLLSQDPFVVLEGLLGAL